MSLNSLGIYAAGDNVDFKFATKDFGGAPITISSGDLRVYKSNSTAPSTAGCTLTADHAGVTGMHHGRIALGADSTFYAATNDFQVMLSTGTVDGVSVIGTVVAAFAIGQTVSLSSDGRVDVGKWLGTQPSTYTTWLPSTGAPTNFVQLNVSTSGVAAADVERWRGTQPSTYTPWLASTEKPTNFSSLVVSTGGIVDGNVQQWMGTQPSTYRDWLDSTDAPANFSEIVASTSGVVQADVARWRGTQPSTYTDWLRSTDKPTNFEQLVVSTSGIAQADVALWRGAQPSTYREWLHSAALSESKDIPSTAPSATGASISDMIRWGYALSRLKLEQNATEQTLYQQGSTAALATAILSATTSLVTRSTWA